MQLAALERTGIVTDACIRRPSIRRRGGGCRSCHEAAFCFCKAVSCAGLIRRHFSTAVNKLLILPHQTPGIRQPADLGIRDPWPEDTPSYCSQSSNTRFARTSRSAARNHASRSGYPYGWTSKPLAVIDLLITLSSIPVAREPDWRVER
jgi:hypothetical protein